MSIESKEQSRKQMEINKIISQKMRQLSKDKQCPVCKRKGAVNRRVQGNFLIQICRWEDCDYTHLEDLLENVENTTGIFRRRGG